MLSIKLLVQYCDKSTEQAMKEYGHAAINGVPWDLNVKKIMFGSACSPDLQHIYFKVCTVRMTQYGLALDIYKKVW